MKKAASQVKVAKGPVIFNRSLSYPFPLRPDVTITICDVPRDLRAVEVDLIAQFLKALVPTSAP